MLNRLLFLLLCTGLLGCSGSVNDPALELAQHEGQEAEYRLQLERASQQNPTDPVAAYNLAWLLHHQGDSQAAWAPAQKAMSLFPLSASYRMLAGFIQQDLGDHFQAVNLLSAALRLDDRLLEAYTGLAKSFVATGRYDEAIQQLGIALQIEPLYFQARINRVKAQLLSLGSQPNEASLGPLVRELELALDVKPGSQEGTLLLAQLYHGQGADLKAKFLLEEWLKTYGDKDEALLVLSQLYLTQDQPDKARSTLARLKKPGPAAVALNIQLKQTKQPALARLAEIQSQLKSFPSSLQLHLLNGQTLLELGRNDRAERVLQGALTLEPKSVDAYLLLALVYAAQSDYIAEQQALHSAEQLAPHSMDVNLALAESLIRRGLYPQAAAKISRNPVSQSNRKLMLLRARVSVLTKDYAGSERWVSQAEKLGDDEASKLARATLEISQGQLKLGIKHLKALLLKSPHNLEAKLILAQGYLKADQASLAVSLLRPLVDHKFGQGRVHLLLARALLNQGKMAQSIAVLKNGLRLWPRSPDLVQLYTAELGFLGKWKQAIPLLEEMMFFDHQFSQLFAYRLWEFYQKSGKREEFRLYRLPNEL